jgi:hypothetical protein
VNRRRGDNLVDDFDQGLHSNGVLLDRVRAVFWHGLWRSLRYDTPVMYIVNAIIFSFHLFFTKCYAASASTLDTSATQSAKVEHSPAPECSCIVDTQS